MSNKPWVEFGFEKCTFTEAPKLHSVHPQRYAIGWRKNGLDVIAAEHEDSVPIRPSALPGLKLALEVIETCLPYRSSSSAVVAAVVVDVIASAIRAEIAKREAPPPVCSECGRPNP